MIESMDQLYMITVWYRSS